LKYIISLITSSLPSSITLTQLLHLVFIIDNQSNLLWLFIYIKKSVCIIYLLILFGENKSTVVYVAKKKTVRERTVSYNTFKFADGIANKIWRRNIFINNSTRKYWLDILLMKNLLIFLLFLFHTKFYQKLLAKHIPLLFPLNITNGIFYISDSVVIY